MNKTKLFRYVALAAGTLFVGALAAQAHTPQAFEWVALRTGVASCRALSHLQVAHIRSTIKAGATGERMMDLLAECGAAQLSLAGRADRIAPLKAQLNCYGVNPPVALYTDTLLSSFSAIGELLAATDQILENNIADEFVRLLPIYAQLRANCC